MVRIPTKPSSASPASPGSRGPLASRLTAGSADPVILPFTVLYDHRERAAGWRFTGIFGDSDDDFLPLIVPARETHLKTGDYMVQAGPPTDLKQIIVERKSHDDLIGSIGGGHVNFRREHERMKEIVEAGGACFVVIESGYDRVLAELEDPTSARQLDPHSIEGVVASWPMQFRVPWYFAGDRRRAEVLCLRLLRTWWKKLSKEK